MKKLFILPILILLIGCKAALFNSALEKAGIYEDTIALNMVSNEQKSIVFFPMHHIGTELFYQDVKQKVDSLNNLGYFFYLESVTGDKEQDTIVRKYKKISGIPFTEKGYTESIDSVLGENFNPKKHIINQPSYVELGVATSFGKRVDVDYDYIITYYENNYSKIVLEDCDYETDLYEISTCEDNSAMMTNEVREDVIVNSRNYFLINYILEDATHDKIAIIYGKGHYKGLKEGLLNEGYTEQ